MYQTVVDYDTAWPQKFELEVKELTSVFGDVINNIHHIGSTAVPGLKAKPIIDILMDVKDLEILDLRNFEIEQIGYEVLGEYGIKGRRYYRKGKTKRTHHVHAFKSGDSNIIRHLAFRDYLTAYKDVANEYGELKYRIASSISDFNSYCDRKEPFILYHEQKALKWYLNYNSSL